MTVTYSSKVSSAGKLGIFWKLLFRWRGSIYKLIWPEMLIFIILYYGLRFTYKFGLSENPNSKRTFEDICLYCQNFTDMIPLTFVLGFYVNIVMTRWWDQYKMIPWPDNLAVFVSTSIQGLDERGRLMRRTIMRYVNLAFVMNLSMISPRVKKRFPTKEHLVEAGLMTKNEKDIFEKLDDLYTQPKYWMPLVWAGTIATRARKEGRIRDDFAVKTILDTINVFRSGLGGLLGYDRISVPLVYTQVVTLAVYSFFIGTLFARQYLDLPLNKRSPQNQVDLYVPWFTILQFLFYMGWLKVAESLINPFGEDDDDFEVNWLIDRDIQLSYLIVDGMHSEHPDMVQDKYWDEGIPQDLPYTVAAEHFRTGPHMGSTAHIEVPHEQQHFLKHENIDDLDSDSGLNTPRTRKKLAVITEDNAESDSEAINMELPDGLNERSESDLESVLWVTPKSIPKNPSILSLIRQHFQNQNPHRRLSKKSSNSSSQGIAAAFKKTESPGVLKKTGTRGESAIFKLSLESLKENGDDSVCEKSFPGETARFLPIDESGANEEETKEQDNKEQETKEQVTNKQETGEKQEKS